MTYFVLYGTSVGTVETEAELADWLASTHSTLVARTRLKLLRCYVSTAFIPGVRVESGVGPFETMVFGLDDHDPRPLRRSSRTFDEARRTHERVVRLCGGRPR